MQTDHIRYDLLTSDAMRGVLRRVLTDVAEYGLPGEHHFFITFLSKADGVTISSRLLAQYPEEMTVILQHQFWDLTVTEDHFEVGLSFGGVPERLVVPFSAIKGFFDPSVQFGLQFETAETEKPETEKAEIETSASETSTTAMPTAPSPTALAVPADPSRPAAAETEDKPKQGADVVRLDRFRKK